MENKKINTKNLVIIGLLIAMVLIMSTTPLGTLPVGPLSITLNMIPIAIAAIAVGPIGGLIVGGVFGMYSFLQAIGIGVPSGMGMFTFAISPFLTFVQRFVSRALTGFLLGYVYKGFKKVTGPSVGSFITGAFAALLNFVFFMGLLWLCFGFNPEFADYLNNTIGKATMLIYVCGTFISNTIFEIIASTVLVGAVCCTLRKARIIEN